MIPAYDKNIVEYAMDNLGCAMDYAVNILHLDGQEFLNLFASTGVAKEFGAGNFKYVTGMTGVDLVEEVLSISGKGYRKTDKEFNGDYSSEYWCGWILAYYQWHSGIPFKKLLPILTFDLLRNSYGVLHEADESKAVDVFDSIVRSESFLARMRKKRGYTQAALAKQANVSLRSIQLYEQRINDIGKAQYNNLTDIARVLHCDIEDILE